MTPETAAAYQSAMNAQQSGSQAYQNLVNAMYNQQLAQHLASQGPMNAAMYGQSPIMGFRVQPPVSPVAIEARQGLVLEGTARRIE